MRIEYAIVCAILTLLGSILSSTRSEAATCNTTDDSAICRAVVDTIDQLKTGDFSDTKYDRITVTCYHAPSTAMPVCAGGGDFDKRSETGGQCTAIADGAYVIADGRSAPGPDCFQRKNFGLNGVVDARQCGLVGDGLTDDTGALSLCLREANSLKIPVVNTGGGIVLLNTGGIEIFSNTALTCGGPPGGLRAQIALNHPGKAVPYYTLPHSIVLNPSFTIMRDANSLFENCLVLPSWYQGKLGMVTTTRTTRSLIDNIEKFFSGTATTCGAVDASGAASVDGEACDMHDVMIVGFDVCDDSANPNRAVLRNLKYECNVGELIHAVGGGMRLDNIDRHNYIEGGLNNIATGKDISKTEWPRT